MTFRIGQSTQPRKDGLLAGFLFLAVALTGCMQAAPPVPPARLRASERQLAGGSSERAFALVGSPGRPSCQLTPDQIKSLEKAEVAKDEAAPLRAADGLVTFALLNSKIVPCTLPEFKNALVRNPEYRIATLFGCASSPKYLTCELENTTSAGGDGWRCVPAESSTVKQETAEPTQPVCH